MKPKCIYLFRSATLVVLSLLLVGCSPKYIIKSSDFHQLQVGSPLSELNPRTFAFKEFVDVRNVPPQLVWEMGGGVTIDQPIATVITSAIRKDFERNGHKTLLYPTQSKTDFIIEGTVYKFSLVQRVSFWRSEVIGNVAIKFIVTQVNNGNKVLVRKYEGEYSYFNVGLSAAMLTGILDQALLMMIKDMSLDQELNNFLKN